MGKPFCFRGVLGLLAGLSALALCVSSAAADEAEARYRIGLNHKRKGETAQAIVEIGQHQIGDEIAGAGATDQMRLDQGGIENRGWLAHDVLAARWGEGQYRSLWRASKSLSKPCTGTDTWGRVRGTSA